MDFAISPDNQRYLDDLVRVGAFPSRDAALNAAISALRETSEPESLVPPEHEAALEEAMAESEAGLSSPMTDDDWAELRRIASEAAAKDR